MRIERLSGYGETYTIGTSKGKNSVDFCGQLVLTDEEIAHNDALAALIEKNDPAAVGQELFTTANHLLEVLVVEGRAMEIVIHPDEPFQATSYGAFDRQFKFEEPGPCVIRVRLKSDHEVFVDFENMVVVAEEQSAPATKPVEPPPAVPFRAIDPNTNAVVEVPAVAQRPIIVPAAPVANETVDEAEEAAQAFLAELDSLPPEQSTEVLKALNTLNQIDSLPPEHAIKVKQAAKHLKDLPPAARTAVKAHVARRSTVPPAPQGTESSDTDLSLDIDVDVLEAARSEPMPEQTVAHTTHVDEAPVTLEQPVDRPDTAAHHPTAHMTAIASDVGPSDVDQGTIAPTPLASSKKKGKTVSYTLLAAVAAAVLALVCYGAMKAATPATPVAVARTSTAVPVATPRPTVAQAKPKVVDCVLTDAPTITDDGYVFNCR